MAVKPWLIFTVALTILPSTTALPPETIANAADTLSNSGYVAMSLTLNLVSTSLLSQTQITTATIFTPPDSVFTNSGQPPLSLLQLHISPLLFSLSSLLPGTTIPTLSSANDLTVTTSSDSDQVSINNVNVIGSPIFDDGLLIVYGIESFFDPDLDVSNGTVQIDRFDSCDASYGGDANFSFHNAGNVLISRGYSVIASFLNLQLPGLVSGPSLTVFAPVDDVMVEYSDRFPDYPSLFLRHVLPCKMSWRELDNIENGTELSTYLSGFRIRVTRSGVTLMVNEVPIAFPDMYYSDWLVIHGVSEALSVPDQPDDDDVDDDGDVIPSSNDTDTKAMSVHAASTSNEF